MCVLSQVAGLALLPAKTAAATANANARCNMRLTGKYSVHQQPANRHFKFVANLF
jgi:hypothetical protein